MIAAASLSRQDPNASRQTQCVNSIVCDARHVVLIAHQEQSFIYRSSMERTKPHRLNMFAFLPNEIVNDIVRSYEIRRECDAQILGRLTQLSGSFSACGKNALDEFRSSFTLNNPFYRQTDQLAQLKANATSFFGNFKAENFTDRDCNLLELLGSRFSTIAWCDNDLRNRRTEKEAWLLVLNFFKRQLKSKYLRRLEISSNEMNTVELNDLFVNFVTRPHFEELSLLIIVTWSTTNTLPFEVIEAAHQSWASTVHFEVPRKLIGGEISEETFIKIKTKFLLCSNQICWKHPLHSKAQMKIYVTKGICKKSYLSMEFLDLQK